MTAVAARSRSVGSPRPTPASQPTRTRYNDNGHARHSRDGGVPMAKFTVSLPESLREYVEAQVAAGGFKTAADYVSFVVCMDQLQNAVPSFQEGLLEKLQL